MQKTFITNYLLSKSLHDCSCICILKSYTEASAKICVENSPEQRQDKFLSKQPFLVVMHSFQQCPSLAIFFLVAGSFQAVYAKGFITFQQCLLLSLISGLPCLSSKRTVWSIKYNFLVLTYHICGIAGLTNQHLYSLP